MFETQVAGHVTKLLIRAVFVLTRFENVVMILFLRKGQR